MRRVKWLRKALRNIHLIHDYIAEADAEAAAKVVLKIQTGVEQLEQFPMLGYGGRVQGTRELAIVTTPYFVVYRVQGNSVQILRVLHHSKQYPS
jgi:addiction module RelE/StbE family toxin